MKSPFTGKEMKLVYEKRTSNFRGEQFEFEHTAWLCEDTGEQFTTDDSDTAAFVQVTNQYRAKYGIPYTDEIIDVRKRYGISAAKMSQILGIGVNQYRLYEQGEVPSVSNGRMIRSVMNPKVMLEMVESSKNEMSKSEYDRIVSKVKAVIAESEAYKLEQYETKRLFTVPRGADNGYAQISLDRLKNILLYFIEKSDGVFFTKMNKLLFYADFMAYRVTGKGMTGLAYKAIAHGPVPVRWDRIYSFYDEIDQEIVQFSDGREGTKLVSKLSPDMAEFSDDELKILEYVSQRFKNETPKQISETSHEEEAWKKYKDSDKLISFEMAFTLKAI
jgi:putative zinc finger/helix-turn-helix YgiT family protein